jgi:hypothetical protein
MADDNKLPLHLREILFAKDAGEDDVDAVDKQLETRKLNGLLHPAQPSDTAQRMIIKSLFARDCEDDIEDLLAKAKPKSKSKSGALAKRASQQSAPRNAACKRIDKTVFPSGSQVWAEINADGVVLDTYEVEASEAMPGEFRDLVTKVFTEILETK